MGRPPAIAWVLLFGAADGAFAERGVGASSVIVGQSAALSGPAAQLGIQMNLGVKTYFDQKAGVTDYNFSSLEGFIVAKVFVEGLKRAGKDPTREKFIAALEGLNYDIGGFSLSFSPSNHQGSKFVELTIIGKNGQFLR